MANEKCQGLIENRALVGYAEASMAVDISAGEKVKEFRGD
jgi:hypothetical protein